MPTRRAFVIAGATFVTGAALGGTYCYSLAVTGPLMEPDQAPSGDEYLEELHRLAVKAPIEELIEKRHNFTYGTFRLYPKDPVLWQGISRLCDAILAGHAMDDRRLFARFLSQVIQLGDPALTRELISRVADLRRVQ